MCDSGFGYSKANAAEKEKQIKSKAKKKKSDKSLRPLKVAGFDSHFSQPFQMILFFFKTHGGKEKSSITFTALALRHKQSRPRLRLRRIQSDATNTGRFLNDTAV